MKFEFSCSYPVALVVLILCRSGVWIALSAAAAYFHKGFYDGIAVGVLLCMAIRGVISSIRELNAL